MGEGLTDWSYRPAGERAPCYREFANHMEQCAQSAVSEQIRNSYMRLAHQWRDLADQVEAESHHVTVRLHDPELAFLLR
jgi:hypothetical protein